MKLGMLAAVVEDAGRRLVEHLLDWARETRFYVRACMRTPEERCADRAVVDAMVREIRRTAPAARANWNVN